MKRAKVEVERLQSTVKQEIKEKKELSMQKKN